MSRVWPSLLGALALATPNTPAQAGGIDVAVCGLPGVTVIIPIDSTPPADNHNCCRNRACHAGCDRKRLSRGDQSR